MAHSSPRRYLVQIDGLESASHLTTRQLVALNFATIAVMSSCCS
jgi:hypothetical protein